VSSSVPSREAPPARLCPAETTPRCRWPSPASLAPGGRARQRRRGERLPRRARLARPRDSSLRRPAHHLSPLALQHAPSGSATNTIHTRRGFATSARMRRSSAFSHVLRPFWLCSNGQSRRVGSRLAAPLEGSGRIRRRAGQATRRRRGDWTTAGVLRSRGRSLRVLPLTRQPARRSWPVPPTRWSAWREHAARARRGSGATALRVPILRRGRRGRERRRATARIALFGPRCRRRGESGGQATASQRPRRGTGTLGRCAPAPRWPRRNCGREAPPWRGRPCRNGGRSVGSDG
jgi:hypothetical protein